MSSSSLVSEDTGGDARLVLLLAAVAGGDRDALAHLYDATAPAALALARSLVLDDAAAQLAVVAAFHLVWRQAPRRAGRCRGVTAWVLALTWRCAQERRGAPQQPLTDR